VRNLPPPWFRDVLDTMLDRNDLTAGQARCVIDYLLGEPEFADAAALLVALRMKGESATELAAAAAALRERMTAFATGRDDVLDTCGPGGTGDRTFNISTAAAIVAAGAGVPVVKHGNRAVSSLSGSADVLRELGLPIESGPAWARRCLDAAGLAFCFAPHFHPILARLGDLRRRLGVRTIFNCLGPLANPAAASYQLLGLGRTSQLDSMAGALAILGTRHALVVCGPDGFDEVSLSGPTAVREVRGGTVTQLMWTPDDFGLEPCRVDEFRVADAAASAAVIREVLDDCPGPARRIVVANAAAALLAADRVKTLWEGVQMADASIHNGTARQVLERLRACSTNV
jgi:anthranilate phosphoribosyltransferase